MMQRELQIQKINSENKFRGYYIWIEDSDNGKEAYKWTSDWDKCCKAAFGTSDLKVKDATSQVKGKWNNRKTVYLTSQTTKD